MDSMHGWQGHGEQPAIRFTGHWRQYLPIAASNALLIIVTLGVYRFWATTRQRRYLWSHTELLGESLEWTGTGKEMLVGFLLAIPLFAPVLGLIGYGIPILAGRGLHWSLLLACSALGYFLLFLLFTFARFRALRYRLSRTRWRGIRGGNERSGFHHVGKACGWYAISFGTLGAMYPWTHSRLRNDRWRGMSFGSLDFLSEVPARPLWLSWSIVWVCFAVGSYLLFLFALPGVIVYGPGAPRLVVPLLVYAATGLTYLTYLSAFYRAAIDWMSLDTMTFTLDADLNDWLNFYLVSALLTVATLGLAMLFYRYRKWKFITSRLELHDPACLLKLSRSNVMDARSADGFADAFDIGAF